MAATWQTTSKARSWQRKTYSWIHCTNLLKEKHGSR